MKEEINDKRKKKMLVLLDDYRAAKIMREKFKIIRALIRRGNIMMTIKLG